MTIGIVGNYGNDNQGDDAILEGMIIQLEDTYKVDRKEILVFSNNPKQTREKYGVQSVNLFQRRKTDLMKFIATMIHNKPIIKELDVLLIGGGGILMDLYRNGLFIFSMYSWLARWSKTSTVIYSVGAGPIETKIGKILLKSIGNNAVKVSVRDQESKQLLQSIGVDKEIDVISDPALFIRPSKENTPTKDEFHIGVTAVPYYHTSYWPIEDKQRYRNYIQGMADSLDNILRKNSMVRVNFFSTKHPYDTNVTKDIQQLMTNQSRTTVCDNMLTHEEVLEFVQNQDLVIGTRLHSLILAVVTETPILAVSYHRKVQSFMDLIGCSENVISIDKLHDQTDFLLHNFNQMRNHWETRRAQSKMVLQQMKNKTPNGMDLLKDIYPFTTLK